MSSAEAFLQEVEKVAKILKGVLKEKRARIFAHFDCDGITSAAIVCKTFLRENFSFTLSFLKRLTREKIKEFELAEDEVLLLLDMGSGHLAELEDFCSKTQVFVFDHHHFFSKFSHPNFFFLNPLVFFQEKSSLSTSIVCYFLSKFFNPSNSLLVDLALVGALGDELEESWSFEGLPAKLVQEAAELGRVSITQGIRIYGRSKPLHQALAHTFNPYIPGVTGSESNAAQFLSEIGLQLKEGNEWKKLKYLSLEEQKKLCSAIIMERLKDRDKRAEDIFGNVYTLPHNPEDFQDAREFATLLNACGKLGKPWLGLKACLQDFSASQELLEVFEEYRKALSQCLEAANEANFLRKKFLYFLARDKIPDTLVGTVTSILLSMGVARTIFSFAESEEGLKVSARSCDELNLGELLSKASRLVGGEGGGHAQAAGASIPKGTETKFIEIVESLA